MEGLIGEIRRPPQEDIGLFAGGFDSFTVTAYFNLLFIALENGFRSKSKKEKLSYLMQLNHNKVGIESIFRSFHTSLDSLGLQYNHLTN